MTKLRDIKKAFLLKRIVALVMDLAVTLFAFFAFLELVFSPIARKAFNYKELNVEASNIQLSSHLYVKFDESKAYNTPIYNLTEADVLKNNEVLGTSDFKEVFTTRISYYYLNYKTGNVAEGELCANDYDKEIVLEDGTKVLPKDYYTEEWFNENFKELDTIDKCHEASAVALTDFMKYINPYNNKIKRIEIFMIAPSFLLAVGGFYILVPLLYKNGETFGKKVMRIGIISNDGYSVKKRQIVARQLFIFVCILFSTFVIGVGLTSFATLAAAIAIYLILIAISKENRSLADLLAFTYVIDVAKSVWFDTPEIEQEKEKQVNEQMKKYSKYKPDNKHVIQIGDKIVDEEVKKDFLKSKKTKK